MRLAIKVGADQAGYEHIKKITNKIDLDFIELMPLMDGDFYRKFRGFNIPITIHAPHDSQGATPSDKSKYKRTIKCLKESQRAADYLNSNIIVVHPGRYLQGISKEEAKGNSIKIFSKINDKRILLENLIYLEEYVKDFCSNAEEMKEIMDILGYDKFCLDFAHATLTEHSRERGYKQVIEEFMKLNPKYFHICGGDFLNYKTEHSHIFKGDFDIPFFKKQIPENGMLVFETPKEPFETRVNEIRYFRGEIDFYRI